MFANPTLRFQWPWVMTSVALLVLYLCFFHFCLRNDSMMCMVAGITSWLIWMSFCFAVRSVFLNRFEYWIHQFVGLDLLLEGFSPLHEGLGFYYCASCFWFVFLVYQCIGASSQHLVPLRANSADIGFLQ